MRFEVKTGDVARQRTDCVVVPLFSGGQLSGPARALDAAGGGFIRRLLRRGDFNGESGETMLLTETGGLPCQRVLLVGCGPRAGYNRKAYRKAARAAFMALAQRRLRNVVFALPLEPVPETDAYRAARVAVEVWHDASYRFTAMKSEKPKTAGEPPRRIGLLVAGGDARRARTGVVHGAAVAAGCALARELGNLPPNVCTPSYLLQQARSLARANRRLSVRALGIEQIRRLRMGAFVAVTQGSATPPRFIVIQYRGAAPATKPVVLVGKGITFDAGGISLKPAAAMDEMKFDMCGAAPVLGVVKAVAKLGLKQNVIGIVPACENLPSGTATRPGDIVRTMSGKTVEILNTDAEGRLILCDALAYARRFKPAALIDIATLTGACVVALGRHRSGLLSNSDRLAETLLAAGEAADDRAWRMPLDDEYGEQLKSNFADMANVGGREAGTITAAAFLSRFVGDSDWAHLDIAGTAWTQGSRKGGTGRPVPLLVEYLLNR